MKTLEEIKNDVAVNIVGIGYYSNTDIGKSYLEINIVSMWENCPRDTFIFYKNGSEYYLKLVTKIDETSYTAINLKYIDITENIKNNLTERGYTFKT